MPDLTPLEAAEKMEAEATRREQLYKAAGFTDDDYGLIDTLRFAASYLRAISAGEYRQVVHGQWIKQDCQGDYGLCSECGCRISWIPKNYKFCPSCGALMDGKGDSHKDKTIDSNDIARFPTIDAIRVVHCKDCRFLGVKDLGTGYCKGKMVGIINPYDFCSYGERRDR